MIVCIRKNSKFNSTIFSLHMLYLFIVSNINIRAERQNIFEFYACKCKNFYLNVKILEYVVNTLGFILDITTMKF